MAVRDHCKKDIAVRENICFLFTDRNGHEPTSPWLCRHGTVGEELRVSLVDAGILVMTHCANFASSHSALRVESASSSFELQALILSLYIYGPAAQ
jgi:hypothetical protein